MHRARLWFGLLAVANYVSLEAALLYGLYYPEYRESLETWIIYPSAVVLAVSMVLVSAREIRKYLIQPAIALLIIMVLSGLQEAVEGVNLAIFVGHVGAIVWFVTGFIVYAQAIPPAHAERKWLSRIAGLSLALLELPYLLYIVKDVSPSLESNSGAILRTLIVTTVVFGLVLVYIVWLNYRSHKLLTTTQGS